MKPKDRCTEGAKFGLEGGQLETVVNWTTDAIESGKIGIPGVFFSVDQARAFAERFLIDQSGVRLLGIGLADKYVNSFLAEMEPLDIEAPSGVYEAIKNRNIMKAYGNELGWEILCYDCGSFCSWLCNSLETEVFEKFGIKPVESGFLDTAEQAEEVASYCGLDKVGAEPGFWAPWLIVEYPIRGEIEV